MLAEKKVDTNVYGGAGSQNGDAQRPLRENEQNVKNRAREARFNAHIQRCAPLPLPLALPAPPVRCCQMLSCMCVAGQSRKRRRGRSCRTRTTCTESQYRRTWRRGDVLWRLRDRRARNGHPRTTSTTGMWRDGTCQTSSRQAGAWTSRGRSFQDDLPARPRCKIVCENWSIRYVSLESQEPSRNSCPVHQMDRLHTFTNSALQTTRVAEANLDRRFALLNISLASRSQPAPPSAHPDPSALSSYIIPTQPRPPATDPQDLFRALSRIDVERPQTQIGDAARRAMREVQRAADSSAGERRLTGGVPPPTPRKPPGTPRRATTPGRGR